MSKAQAAKIRSYFSKIGFGVGVIYGPDPDDDEPDDWKFFVFAGTSKDHDSALGEIHVTKTRAWSEGATSRTPHPILEAIMRQR